MVPWNGPFESGQELGPWQMAACAVAVFFSALVLIRASGRRSFGQHSPFDARITVLLGAVLSRAVGRCVSVLGHGRLRGCAGDGASRGGTRKQPLAAFRRSVERSRGCAHTQREIDVQAMRSALVSERNTEAIRQQVGDTGIEAVHLAVLERDGKLTVVKRM